VLCYQLIYFYVRFLKEFSALHFDLVSELFECLGMNQDFCCSVAVKVNMAFLNR